MTDDGYDLDRALEQATERTRDADVELDAETPQGPDVAAGAVDVERRDEELAVLSDEALQDRLPPRGSRDPDEA